jgi:hypothetical protein
VILPEVWLLEPDGGFEMGRKRHKPEEIVAKLMQVAVLMSQVQSVVEAVRSIGVINIEGNIGEPAPRRSARAIVIAEALSKGRIREWFFADAVTRRILQALPIQIDDIALEPSVVGQHLPRQRMVAFAKP